MADDTPPPDDDKPRRPWEKKKPDRDDDPPAAGRKKPRDRDREDDEEWEEDDRPRRRRRRREEEYEDEEYDPALRMVVPINTSALAIVAGYLGLVSVLCLPAPFALLFGIMAMNHLRKNPKLDGKGRAIFAIVMGVIFSGVMVVAGVAMLLSKQ